MWSNLFLGGGVLFIVVGAWFAVHYWLTPYLENPDGKARLTGQCGDTVELCLSFKANRVADTSYWTNGCTHSRNCVSAAASLAIGRTPDEILDIDANLVQRSVGGLSRDYMHCAALATETLQAALGDYMLKRKARSECSDCKLMYNKHLLR
jgi:NifU-like protein involved in Fe-S cluster formation